MGEGPASIWHRAISKHYLSVMAVILNVLSFQIRCEVRYLCVRLCVGVCECACASVCD